MALIGMACYSTAENGKDEYLQRTLDSLRNTVNFKNHSLELSVNAFTPTTLEILKKNNDIIRHIFFNEKNLGTAEAINLIWQRRVPGQHCIKMDDDVIIYGSDWIGDMEEAIRRDPKIGQIGLKRRDCMESPWHPDPFYRSKVIQLPHQPGEKWLVVEEVNHVMGTCQLYNSALLDKIGYLYQPKLYGFDDSIASARSKLAGFKNCFLTKVDIEHIDPGTTPFQKWKEAHANEYFQQYIHLIREYTSRKRSIYYNPFEK